MAHRSLCFIYLSDTIHAIVDAYRRDARREIKIIFCAKSNRMLEPI